MNSLPPLKSIFEDAVRTGDTVKAARVAGQVVAATETEQPFPREQMDTEMAGAGFKMLAAYDFLSEQFLVVYGVR